MHLTFFFGLIARCHMRLSIHSAIESKRNEQEHSVAELAPDFVKVAVVQAAPVVFNREHTMENSISYSE